MILPWLGAALGGVLGAALWAAVAYFFQVEVGWLAWAIGGICGFGARLLGPQHAPSFATGAGAALIAVASIVGGKILCVHFAVGKVFDASLASINGDDSVKMALASAIVEERTSAGEPVSWPHGRPPSDDEDYTPAIFPRDVWAEAQSRYAALAPAEKQELKDGMRASFQQARAQFEDEAKREGLKESFGALDLVFLALAVATAFKIANGAPKSSA